MHFLLISTSKSLTLFKSLALFLVFRRIQLPLKIPTGKKCYIEWLDTKEKIYWEQSKIEIFNVEKLHRGANESDESMEFLYIDVDPDIEVEL